MGGGGEGGGAREAVRPRGGAFLVFHADFILWHRVECAPLLLLLLGTKKDRHIGFLPPNAGKCTN